MAQKKKTFHNNVNFEDFDEESAPKQSSKKKRFHLKFTPNDGDFRDSSRKADSQFYRRHSAAKKIPYIHFLIKNVKKLVIVSSLNFPKPKPGLIDRFLILAGMAGVEPVLVFTKQDLSNDEDGIAALYKAIGYKTYCLANSPVEETFMEESHKSDIQKYVLDKESGSIYDGRGELLFRRQSEDEKNILNLSFKEMRSSVFEGSAVALVGHSGVGKTALLRKIDSSYQAAVKSISLFTRRGRHTTTRVQRHDLSFGGFVYDMPGLKEVDFIYLERSDIKFFYKEFKEFSKLCRFKNCLHIEEPHCAVKEAVEDKHIHVLRYQSYKRIAFSIAKRGL